MKIKLVQNVIQYYYHNCRCQIHQSFEQLLFYEFAPATDRDIFKRGGAQIFSLPYNRTSAQHLPLPTKSVRTVHGV
jgi:hypothetical protein